MLIAVLCVFIFFNLVFAVAIKIKNNSIADIAWGIGFIIISLSLLIQADNLDSSRVIVCILVIMWAARLSGYIYIRNADKPEDFRYANWRKSWGKKFIITTYLRVFMLQMCILILIALPVFIIFSHEIKFNSIGLIGMIIAVFGVIIETVSDWQMMCFKKNMQNRGKIMQSGLWAYSRHPNYFGESLFWSGIGLMAAIPDTYYLSLLSPLLITFLLLYVSGVPLLEKKYRDNVDFQAYSARTSRFILWLPKK